MLTIKEREAIEWELAEVLYKAMKTGYWRPRDPDNFTHAFHIWKPVREKIAEKRNKEVLNGNGLDGSVQEMRHAIPAPQQNGHPLPPMYRRAPEVDDDPEGRYRRPGRPRGKRTPEVGQASKVKP